MGELRTAVLAPPPGVLRAAALTVFTGAFLRAGAAFPVAGAAGARPAGALAAEAGFAEVCTTYSVCVWEGGLSRAVSILHFSIISVRHILKTPIF